MEESKIGQELVFFNTESTKYPDEMPLEVETSFNLDSTTTTAERFSSSILMLLPISERKKIEDVLKIVLLYIDQ